MAQALRSLADLPAPGATHPSAAAQVFVVGVPRSGTTLVSMILNHSGVYLSLNDLYFLQRVASFSAFAGRLSVDHAHCLLDHLLDLVAKRSTSADRFIGQIFVASEALAAVRQTMHQRIARQAYTWHGLQQETLDLLAGASGHLGWADKTPQNYLYAERLLQAFPAARLVYVLRHVVDVLNSMKHADHEGHDARRYHPIVYALHWRSAVRSYLAHQRDGRVTMLRYEDLVSAPPASVARLEAFLGTRLGPVDIGRLGSNSSFAGRARERIPPAEAWLCQWLCRTELKAMCYAPLAGHFEARYLPELAAVTWRFLKYQAARFARSADARGRMFNFVLRVLSDGTPGAAAVPRNEEQGATWSK